MQKLAAEPSIPELMPPKRGATADNRHVAELERELQAARIELAEQIRALHESQARLQAEIAERERIIAERGETERKLRQSEETFRKLFDYNLDSMTISDVAGRNFIDVNEEYLRHTGYRRDEVIGKRTRELDPFYDPGEAAKFIAGLKTHLVVRNLEVRFKRRDGSPYPVLASAIVLQLGGRPCCVTISRDISALKETQRELVEAREAALAASQAKSQFLSAMSHEIRTPLNAVLGMADLLWESRLDNEQRRYVEIMCTNGAALLDLINDILDLAKVESGRLNLEKTDFDLREAVDKAADTVGIRAHEKRLELAVRVVPGVPQRIVGDPMRLRQMLLNLLGNAVKFTETGEIVLTVEMAVPRAASGPAILKFSVSDTGIGISAAMLDSIFSPFTQADYSTARKFGGSGLGLAIVKRLVELHHGQISVRSEPGKGSTFSFTAEFGLPPEPDATAPASAGAQLKDLRVLVVDDTAANRLILQETLASQGAIVTCAKSGEEAIDQCDRALQRGEPYRLVLLDCRMPGMDGIDTARELRSRGAGKAGRQPLLLMLTSDDLSNVRVRAHETGIDTYLVKPVKRAELLYMIDRTLRRQPPAAAASSMHAPASGTHNGAPATVAISRPRAILLADDAPDNRFLVRAFLKDAPYAIDEAEDGVAALEKFKLGRYGLVLMDIRMPRMDGYEATRAIREFEREAGRERTPVVALTASALDEAVRKALDAGCDAHIAKPVKKTALLTAIRAALGEPAAAAESPAAPPPR